VIGAAEALIVKKDIKLIADLKGKKVATPFGSTAHFSL
jgi:taurine transport system substrate-binding protein